MEASADWTSFGRPLLLVDEDRAPEQDSRDLKDSCARPAFYGFLACVLILALPCILFSLWTQHEALCVALLKTVTSYDAYFWHSYVLLPFVKNYMIYVAAPASLVTIIVLAAFMSVVLGFLGVTLDVFEACCCAAAGALLGIGMHYTALYHFLSFLGYVAMLAMNPWCRSSSGVLGEVGWLLSVAFLLWPLADCEFQVCDVDVLFLSVNRFVVASFARAFIPSPGHDDIARCRGGNWLCVFFWVSAIVMVSVLGCIEPLSVQATGLLLAVPEILPRSIDPTMSRARWTFWPMVFLCKWVLLVLSSVAWHTLLNRFPQLLFASESHGAKAQSKAVTQQLRSRTVAMFFVYHMVHNGVLCTLTIIAIRERWISLAGGLHFEVWNQWINFLLVVGNATCIVKYAVNIGRPLEMSTMSVGMALVPVFGSDFQLGKEWLFIGVAMDVAGMGQGHTAIAYGIATLSVVALVLPSVALLFKEYYAERPQLALNFVYSHWPVVGSAQHVNGQQQVSADWSTQKILMDKMVDILTQAFTPWHWEVAVYNECPQACLHVAFMLIIHFEPSVLFAFVVSLLKLVAIRSAWDALPSLIKQVKSGLRLVKYAQSHGKGGVDVLQILYAEGSDEAKLKKDEADDEALQKAMHNLVRTTDEWAFQSVIAASTWDDVGGGTLLDAWRQTDMFGVEEALNHLGVHERDAV